MCRTCLPHQRIRMCTPKMKCIGTSSRHHTTMSTRMRRAACTCRPETECASRKHASKQTHGHTGMRPEFTLVPALLDQRARQHAHSNTCDAKPGARGCCSHIARMQVYATQHEYTTALWISRFAKHYGSAWGCRVMPRVRSTTTPRRVALAASRSQFGRVRVRRGYAVLLACASRAQPGAARLHNLGVLDRSETRSDGRRCVAQGSTLSPVRSRVQPLAVSHSHTSERGVATKTQCLF